MKETPPTTPPIVWVAVEAQIKGKGSEWAHCRIPTPPKTEEVDNLRAEKLTQAFHKPFPTGTYVQVQTLERGTYHWVPEEWIRVPGKPTKKLRKPIPVSLAEFVQTLRSKRAESLEKEQGIDSSGESTNKENNEVT